MHVPRLCAQISTPTQTPVDLHRDALGDTVTVNGIEWRLVKESDYARLESKLIPYYDDVDDSPSMPPDFDRDDLLDFYFKHIHQEDPKAEIQRMHEAAQLHGVGLKPITVAEWRTYRLILLLGALRIENGVQHLWENKQYGFVDPPNFGRFMNKTRFIELQRWSVFAFATDLQIRQVSDRYKNKYNNPFHATSWDMIKYRQDNMRKRTAALFPTLPTNIIRDEWRMAWRTSAASGLKGDAPHIVANDHKPDKIAVEAGNIASVQYAIPVGEELEDDPERMSQLKYSDVYPATVANELRVLEAAGYTGDSRANYHGDSKFGSVALVRALADVFPKIGATAVVKTACKGFPKAYISTFLESQHGNIKPAGTHVFLYATFKNQHGDVRYMIAAGHKYKEQSIQMVISTHKGLYPGPDYHQRHVEYGVHGKVHVTKPIPRPTMFTRYFLAAGVIDNINRHSQHDLRLWASWPVRHFWKKVFIDYEMRPFTDMYMLLRSTGRLYSFEGSPEPESLLQFLNRFLKCLLPPSTRAEPGAGKVPMVEVGRPHLSEQSPEPHGSRKRKTPPGANLGHTQCHAKPRPGSAQKYRKGACQVCKHRRTKLENGNYPETRNVCSRCQNFVHGHDPTGRYPTCWTDHLMTCTPGLVHSGECGSNVPPIAQISEQYE